MKNIILFIIAAYITALSFNNAKAQTNIPVIQADTVFAGFGDASVSGIVFGPDGNTVILMHNATPTEIDIKTRKVLREFEAVPNAVLGQFYMFIDKQKNYLGGSFYSTKYFDGNIFSGEIIWDVMTGKIIKTIPNALLLTNGQQYYTYIEKNNQEYLGKFDINTFKMVDSIYLPKDLEGDGYAEWGSIGIIPNSNKVFVSVKRCIENESGDKTYLLSELYLLDFDTKKYTKIPIPYEPGQKSSEIYQIKVSEKYSIVEIDSPGTGTTFYFYDQNLNFLYKLTKKDFINMTDMVSVSTSTIVTSIMDENLIFYLSNNSSSDRMAFYNIQEKKVTKYLGFLGGGTYDKTSNKIALIGTILGLTGIYDLYALPVKDLSQIISPDVVFSNNQLEYYTDKAFVGQSFIYDATGKLIVNLGSLVFISGKNIIRVHQTLPIGVYILTIKNGTEQISKKFIVD